MPRPTYPWPELDDQLRALWADGVITHEIGKRLGVTKNSAIGRAHRLKLPLRHMPPGTQTSQRKHVKQSKQTAPEPRPKVERKPAHPKPEPPPPPIRLRTPAKKRKVNNGPLSILEVGPFQCRAIIGDVKGAETMMCAQPIVMEARSPYCAEHQRAFGGAR